MQIISIELLLDVLAFTATTILGLVIYFRNQKSWTHRFFFILAILIDCYIIVNYLSLHPPLPTPENQLFWIRVVMFVTSFVGPILVLFVYTFPRDGISMKRRYMIPLIGLMSTSAIAALTPLVFRDIQYPSGEPVPIPGPGILIFFVDFVGLFLLSFAILIYKYRMVSAEEKKQFSALLWGIIWSFSLMGLSTVIFVVILKTSSFVFLGPVFPVILLAFIAYAIVRHRLFNIKMIATQVFVVVLLLVLFSKIFVLRSFTETLVDTSVFLMTSLFGILLIRSVLKEVEQRERLQALSTQLEEANEHLKVLDQSKSEFVSMAGHQLRTPLTVIKGYVSLVQEGEFGATKKNKKLQNALAIVAHSTDQLVKLVSDLLDLSRIESGKMHYEFKEADFAKIAEGIVKEYAPKAQEKKLKLVFENNAKNLAPFLFDPDKMREVVVNLIDNAIRYSKEGEIIVSVGLTNQNTTLRFSVKDYGIGIKKEDLSQLFVKFSRLQEAKNIEVNGTGIGLYFAKRIVEDQGGRVGVESPGLGKGSTFWVEIPIHRNGKPEVK